MVRVALRCILRLARRFTHTLAPRWLPAALLSPLRLQLCRAPPSNFQLELPLLKLAGCGNGEMKCSQGHDRRVI